MGELGLSFDLGALKIYQMLNRWFVTHTNTTNHFTSVSHFVFFVSVFTQIYNLFKFAIASTFKRRDFCSFLLFCRAFLAVVFSLHLFKVIYCRLFTACCLLSAAAVAVGAVVKFVSTGQLWCFCHAIYGSRSASHKTAWHLPQVARQWRGGGSHN